MEYLERDLSEDVANGLHSGNEHGATAHMDHKQCDSACDPCALWRGLISAERTDGARQNPGISREFREILAKIKTSLSDAAELAESKSSSGSRFSRTSSAG